MLSITIKGIDWNKGYITFFFAVITVILMPVYVWILPPFMILWGIGWVWENWRNINLIFVSKRSHIVLFTLFMVFYAWQFFGMLYSDNPDNGWENLKIRLSIIFFPLVLLYPGELIRNNVKHLLKIFAVSTLTYIIFCFISAFINSVDIQGGMWKFNPHPDDEFWLNYFYGTEFSRIQHPSYQAIYVLISSLICFESWFDQILKKNFRFFWLCTGIFLLISLYFLSSKAGLLAVILLVPLYLFIKIKKRTRSQFTWMIITLGVIFILPVILTNDRMNLFIKGINLKTIREINNLDERSIIWKSAFHVARDNYLWGLGTGDVEDELVREYQQTGNQLLADKRMNAHNQFLEVLLENGIISLVLLTSIFICMLLIGFKEKDFLYGMFALLMILFFLFETMLNRLAGVSFFAMFSFLLIQVNMKDMQNKFER